MKFYQQKMKALIETLRKAQKAYDEGNPIISDKEWDELYSKLEQMEKEYGFIFPDSPTQKVVDYQLVTELKKVKHNHPMLSLPKTKNLEDVDSFFDSEYDWIAMPKLDGLTCSLRYIDGILVSAETRGDGEIGEDVLHNAKVISNIPQQIPTKEEVVVDGEVICTYNNFEQFKTDYKNPRNFAAGSIRLLDARECERRKLSFVVWEVIKGYNQFTRLSEKLCAVESDGFTVVPFMGNGWSKEDAVKSLKMKASDLSYPIDGLVFKYDNIDYGVSLGRTAHHFNNAIAYKFYDEFAYTILRDVEWQMGRTGVLTPVAIFDPVELNGTTCSRASLHNVGIMKQLGLTNKGQEIFVCKSNEIIPQVVKVFPPVKFHAEAFPVKLIEVSNFLDEHELIKIPEICPYCGKALNETSTDILQCNNPNCEGKFINKLVYFVGKKGLDIKGLSKETLSKFIDWGYITDLESIFFLQKYEKEIAAKPGFGMTSIKKILDAIEKARNCKLENFISAIGIPGIGYNIAKDICEEIFSYEEFRTVSDFSSYGGIGAVKTKAIRDFDYTEADKIYEHLNITPRRGMRAITLSGNSKKLEGLTFVITGKLSMSRDESKKFIEDRGGKVTSSISKKTSYLINNDPTSTSSKNTEAARLGIPVLTEEEFFKKFEL